jgi:hypothetical protein
MTEHSLEQSSCLEMLLERLRLIEQIHAQSPGLQLHLQKLRKGATEVIPGLMEKERLEITETQAGIKKAVVEI